jgi:hypothetical protein
MKTEVTMRRKLFDAEIRQKSKSSFFSATDLVASGNKWRILNDVPPFSLKNWMQTKSTKEFISALESQFGKVKINAKAKNQHTWVHPYLFIDIALAIDPKLKIEVYGWLYDELLKYRNDSGDSYNKMTGSLYNNCTNKSTFHKSISHTARMIKGSIGVKDWQSATQDQLKIRDRIHENIALLSDVLRDNNKAVKYGINKTLGNDVLFFDA